jgi:hypothetical protein
LLIFKVKNSFFFLYFYLSTIISIKKNKFNCLILQKKLFLFISTKKKIIIQIFSIYIEIEKMNKILKPEEIEKLNP